VFTICQVVAQKSDPGRRALIDGNILPMLLQLAADTNGTNVTNACHVLNALAHTGSYRSELISVGVREAMTRITRSVQLNNLRKRILSDDILSPFRKSTINNKSDKREAQEAAKRVILTLKSSQ
jgi:hypothetical protein